MNSPVLEVVSLRYRHAGATAEAVAGISFALTRGEVLGVIGPNAAGKSTLARLCCGLLAPRSGEVRLLGDPISRLARKERARRVAFLPQGLPGDLPFTGREVALMGRAPHLGLWSLEGPADERRAEEALAEADALAFAGRPLAQLSGGERQRVFLARAFAQDAAVLVLDEPTAALDLRHQALLVEAVRRKARAGGGTLLVLHDLALAGAACDRVLLLCGGELLAQGSPAEVIRPELLRRAYGAEVDVVAHPTTGHPLVAPRIAR